MLHRARTNPIFKELVAHRSWPATLAAVLVFAAILWVGSRIIPNLVMLPNALTVINNMFRITAVSVALIALIAASAAVLTAIASAGALQRGSYSLLMLSPITNRSIVRGHLIAAFFRLRVLIAALLGVIFVYWYSLVTANHNLNCAARYYYAPCPPGVMPAREISMFAPMMTALTLFALTLIGLVVCAGIAMLLKSRSPAAAIGVSLALIILFMSPASLVLWLFFTRTAGFVLIYQGFGALCLALVAATIAAYRLAVRTARSTYVR